MRARDSKQAAATFGTLIGVFCLSSTAAALLGLFAMTFISQVQTIRLRDPEAFAEADAKGAPDRRLPDEIVDVFRIDLPRADSHEVLK